MTRFSLAFFAIYLNFISLKVLAAQPDCESQKKNFVDSLFNTSIVENISFGLTPDKTHDVVKAIPTKEIGQWFEFRFSLGTLDEVRKVTPLKTITYFFDSACKIKEKQTIRLRRKNNVEFSDDALKNLLERTEKGVLYTISIAHPLSEVALPGIIEAAKKYNLELTLLTDPTTNNEEFAKLKVKYPELKKMESLELIYRGMFNHFPSTLVYKNKKIIGRPLLGARGKEEIDKAFNKLINGDYPQTSITELKNISEHPKFGSFNSGDEKYKVVRKFHFPNNMDIKYIRSIPNSDSILIFTLLGQNAVHIYDTKSEKIIRTFENMTSPYPSSDGKFTVLMNEDHHLAFQNLDENKPFFIDPVSAWYPGVSVVNDANGKTFYRIITRMMELKVKDYAIDFLKNPPVITPLSDGHRVCTNLPINATPYISRFDGNKFTLIQENNERELVKLLDDNTCVRIVNLGFWTWKAAFNFDDTMIGFTGIRVNSLVNGRLNTFNELFVGHSFIYDIIKQQLTELPDGIVSSFSFPEFKSDGSIIVLKKGENKKFMGYIYKS